MAHATLFTSLLVALAASTLTACAPNVALIRPPAVSTGTLGQFQSCGRDATSCKTDGGFDTSRFNESNTQNFPLPSCPYGIDRILVEKVGTTDVVATVQCAAPSPTSGPGIPTTTPGGGTSSPPHPGPVPAPGAGIPTATPGGGTAAPPAPPSVSRPGGIAPPGGGIPTAAPGGGTTPTPPRP
jgi:hypothetical protein